MIQIQNNLKQKCTVGDATFLVTTSDISSISKIPKPRCVAGHSEEL